MRTLNPNFKTQEALPRCFVFAHKPRLRFLHQPSPSYLGLVACRSCPAFLSFFTVYEPSHPYPSDHRCRTGGFSVIGKGLITLQGISNSSSRRVPIFSIWLVTKDEQCDLLQTSEASFPVVFGPLFGKVERGVGVRRGSRDQVGGMLLYT